MRGASSAFGSWDQVGWYKSTNTDAAAGTKAQILTQPALPGTLLVYTSQVPSAVSVRNGASTNVRTSSSTNSCTTARTSSSTNSSKRDYIQSETRPFVLVQKLSSLSNGGNKDSADSERGMLRVEEDTRILRVPLQLQESCGEMGAANQYLVEIRLDEIRLESAGD